jgi:hypothetical protein
MYEALRSILLIPSSSLLRSRGGKKKRAIRALASQLRASSERDVPPLSSQPPSITALSDPPDSRITRAKALIEQGYLGRAARSLFQQELTKADDKTIDALTALHPPSSSLCPPVLETAPLLQQVDPVVLAGIIRRTLANGSAPAVSGWTGDLLKALVDDDDCLNGFVLLFVISLMAP